jgi:hypothetical protein
MVHLFMVYFMNRLNIAFIHRFAIKLQLEAFKFGLWRHCCSEKETSNNIVNSGGSEIF